MEAVLITVLGVFFCSTEAFLVLLDPTSLPNFWAQERPFSLG